MPVLGLPAPPPGGPACHHHGMAVRLEPFAERHLADVARLVDDPEVLRFTRVPEPPPPDFPRRWLAVYEQGRLEGRKEAFVGVDETGTFLGLALAPEIDREGRQLELGYVVAPAARGRGAAREMLRQLTDWAFRELAALRIVLYIDVDNPGSIRVAERCGYRREGVLRSLHVKQELRRDVGLWSRLPTDEP